LRKGKDITLDEAEKNAKEFGANGIVGVDLDYVLPPTAVC